MQNLLDFQRQQRQAEARGGAPPTTPPLQDGEEDPQDNMPQAKSEPQGNAAYSADLRIRATTCRIAAGIEPPHMRIALEKARERGARWYGDVYVYLVFSRLFHSHIFFCCPYLYFNFIASNCDQPLELVSNCTMFSR